MLAFGDLGQDEAPNMLVSAVHPLFVHEPSAALSVRCTCFVQPGSKVPFGSDLQDRGTSFIRGCLSSGSKLSLGRSPVKQASLVRAPLAYPSWSFGVFVTKRRPLEL